MQVLDLVILTARKHTDDEQRPQSQAEVMARPLERFKDSNNLVKQLGTGGFSLVYLSISKTQADTILQRHLDGEIDDKTAASEINNALQASKILNVQSADITFNNETNVLLELSVLNHPNITLLHDYNHGEFDKEWLKLEPFPCGTLEQYAEKVVQWSNEGVSGIAPAAFGWHLIHQLSHALLALHFPSGAKTSFFTHGDIEQKNLLFRSLSSSTGSAAYPDIVLADMGQATKLTNQLTLQQRACFFEQQYMDVRQMLDALRSSFSVVMKHEDLVTSLDEVEMNDSEYGNNNMVLKEWLEKLVDDSKAMRDQEAAGQRGEFGPEVKEYFDRRNLSVDETWDFWIKLKNGRAHT